MIVVKRKSSWLRQRSTQPHLQAGFVRVATAMPTSSAAHTADRAPDPVSSAIRPVNTLATQATQGVTCVDVASARVGRKSGQSGCSVHQVQTVESSPERKHRWWFELDVADFRNAGSALASCEQRRRLSALGLPVQKRVDFDRVGRAF
jgi:hypothetical protein